MSVHNSILSLSLFYFECVLKANSELKTLKFFKPY